jgi:transcriptional regulator with XRE-family HTH domain
VSKSTISRIERGHLGGLQLTTIRAVAEALEIRIEVLPRSRGADLDRIVNAKHAALTEAVVTWLGDYAGWLVRPEFSFSHFGERGVIDAVAWHPVRRALLELEMKSDVIDSAEVLGTVDRRRRLGPVIVSTMSWEPLTVSSLLVIGESDANRRRVASLAQTYDAALPDRIVAVRRYLRDPDHPIRGLIFFSKSHAGQPISPFATVCRVRGSRSGNRAA